MASHTCRTRHGEHGQALVLTAVALIALCAVVGLAFDIGYLFDDKRRAQTAADAAALAGAREWRKAGNAGVVAAANAGAATNGFTNGQNGTDVVVNIPPTSGYYANNPSFLETIVTRSRPTLFLGIVNFQSGTVRARAVAGLKESPNCIYALDPKAKVGLNVSGGSTLNAQCGIVVNSNSNTALNGNGTGSSVTGAAITVTGKYTGCCFSPDPRSDIPPEPDPLGDRAAPTFSGCNYNDTHVTGTVTTLGPGVYCGGIQVSNGGNATLLPGTYVMDGGGFSVSGGSTINGAGVTIYNTATKAKDYDSVTISGDTTGSLTAPTSGPMEGMLFFQDRTITSKKTNSISGGANLTLEGALYFPTTDLNFSGSTAIDSYTILVAATINITGGSTINDSYGDLTDGNPLKTIALGE
jgi:hypothetical protein